MKMASPFEAKIDPESRKEQKTENGVVDRGVG